MKSLSPDAYVQIFTNIIGLESPHIIRVIFIKTLQIRFINAK